MSLNFDSNTEPVTDKHLKINTKGVEECKPNKGRRSNTDPVIGIDLGTTFSSVGICKNNKVEIIVNEYGNRTTPSYVSFDENGQRLIGDGAKNQLVKNSSNTIFDVKRLMGREWNDEFVQNDKEHFPFPVVEKNSRPHIEIQNKNGPKVFSPEEISAMLLKKLAKMAQEYLGQDVKDVVITVPAYFNDAQRQATKNAGTIAGLNVLKILNEPTAAAMAYALTTNQNDKIILLFDLGGGTLDVSIMSIKDTVFTVLATCGNMHLGGEDFDQNVINYFIKLYQTEKGKDFSTNTKAIQKLRREVEKAKRVLTYHSSTIIDIEEFLEDEDFSEILTKEKFEELNKDLFESTLEPLKQALDDAQLKKTHIDEIVMVGGSSRIPKIRELVKEFFDGKEPFQKINPDEAVASGAAIQAGILSGQQDSVILLDVNPLSIGVETFDKTLSVIIPRNTSIPTKVTSSRTTVADYQKCIRYSVYEGELPVAKDNLLLGEFIISNIQSALARVPDILLTMEIDEDGILHTTAEDQVTNSKNDIFINYAKNRLSQEEITEMMKVLEEYDRLEEKYYQSVKARIEFTEAIYRYRNSFDYLNVTDLEKENLTKLVEENLQWLKDNKICQIEEYKERKLLFEKVTDNSFDQNTIEE